VRWLVVAAALLVVAGALLAAPARLEGPVLVEIGAGHGLSLLDLIGLVPLLGAASLLFAGLWHRRRRLRAAVVRHPWPASVGTFAAGVGLGLLVASAWSSFFWWWAVGAGLFTTAVVAATVVAARGRPAGGFARGRDGSSPPRRDASPQKAGLDSPPDP
jgi:hypothetical protein